MTNSWNSAPISIYTGWQSLSPWLIYHTFSGSPKWPGLGLFKTPQVPGWLDWHMYEAGTLPAATMMEHAISFGESGRKKKRRLMVCALFKPSKYQPAE